MYASAASQLTS